MTTTIDGDRPDRRSWVKATTFGWWLGLAIIVLLVLAMDMVAVIEGSQFMVGLGMGAGVGYVQGRLIDRWLGTRHTWFLATTVGMGGPFVAGDVARVAGFNLSFSLAVSVVVGGLLVGLLQWKVLQRHVRRAIWWIPASLLGWLLPVGLMALKDRHILSGVAGDAAGLIGMFFGGIMLGVVTGGVLTRLPARADV